MSSTGGKPTPRQSGSKALEPFEPWDFEALRPPRSRSAEYNEKRLAARRRLEAIAKALTKATPAAGKLEVRTSIHNPFPPVNGGSVERLWAYLSRPKAHKTKLKRELGAELGKDLDQAYRNGYLCVALEADALEVSLRIHPDAWFDGRNLTRRIEAEGLQPLLTLLNELSGFRLQLADWKGEWICGELEIEQLEEFFRFYEPGQHLLAVQQRMPVPESMRDALLTPELPAQLVDELVRLVPLRHLACWSPESDFLFA
ncbi:MAG: hypothetical protein ACPGPE_02455 [Planctomycetota bacterium]